MAANGGCFCFFLSVIICISAGFAYAEVCPSADLNGDCRVDFKDVAIFAQQWLNDGDCQGNPTCADFDGLNGVDLVDFDYLADYWLAQGVPLVINEFMASNNSTSGFHDSTGDYDDWIEIYNFGDTPIDLAGMYLSDKPDNPTKWQFPSGYSSQTTVQAYSFIVIWADEETSEGPLHAGFKLSADGEDIVLSDANGNSIDSITFGPQTANISYGRYPDGPHEWRFMGVPTPGAQNNAGYLGVVSDVDISHSRGFYDSNFVVELFCDDANATIKYTIDSNTPTDTFGLTYNPNTRIPITGTTCLRVAAFRAGYKQSDVKTATYIFLNNIRNQNNSYAYSKGFPVTWARGYADYEMDPDVLNDPNYGNKFETAMKAIPTVSLVTDMKYLFDPEIGVYVNNTWEEIENPVSIEYFDPCTGDDIQANACIHMVGNQSQGPTYTSKHSLRVFFKSQYGPSQLEFPALYQGIGAKKLNNISLRSDYHYSWQDWTHQTAVPRASYLRDMFAQDSLRDMGWTSPYSRNVHVYINGVYWGLYQASERADGAFLGEHLNTDWDNCDSVEGVYDGTAKVESKDGLMDGWNYMYSLFNGFTYDSPMTAAKYAEFEQHVDTNQMADYIIYNTFVSSWDWSSKNWYAGSERNPQDINGPPIDKWKFYTWDSESAINNYTDLQSFPFSGYTEGPPCYMHNRVHKNAVYNRLLMDRINKHLLNGGALTQQANTARWEKRAAIIETAIIAESARWGDFLRDTLGKTAYTLYTPAYWDRERYRMINGSDPNAYFPKRTNWLLTGSWNSYIAIGFYPSVSAPTFSQFGGEITAGGTVIITAGSGATIYYTTNGLEPDGNGTIIASGGSVTINNSLTLKARAYYSSSSKWSALTETNFAVGAVKDKLRITELMYHPAEPGDPCQEFVELKNIGTTTLNLNLVKFAEGIHFTFPNTTLAAGGYILVVEDINAFNAQYGSGKNIAGQYTGSLSNAGERLRLEDAIGRTILDFNYVDSWQDATDGEGFSLNIFDVNTDANNWNKQESWTASKYADGTPCADDTGLLKEHSIAINELLAHSDVSPGDWVEMKNTTSASIDISNWYLSDDADNLTKYRIKAGTVLASGAYLVLSSDANFGPASSDTGKITSFGFSEDGETAYLTSSDGAVITGYREKQDFGASENNVAFGRYQKSTGTYDFVPTSSNTPGAANAYPRVGPVVINEIMYNPPDINGQNSEYIELRNITAGTVNCYGFSNLPWKFTDGISYTFPTGTTIPANGYLLVVATSPTYFRTRYSVPVGITVLGPYSGHLDNSGEKVEVSKPTDIDEAGQPVYTQVDMIVYSDGSHPVNCPEGNDVWPTQADGLGKSLSRKAATAYGNDPNNWQAVSPTPGAANP